MTTFGDELQRLSYTSSYGKYDELIEFLQDTINESKHRMKKSAKDGSKELYVCRIIPFFLRKSLDPIKNKTFTLDGVKITFESYQTEIKDQIVKDIIVFRVTW